MAGHKPNGNGWRTQRLAVMCVTVLVALDLIGVILVRIYTEATPTVLGDISKVGVGILGGVVMERFTAARDGRGGA